MTYLQSVTKCRLHVDVSDKQLASALLGLYKTTLRRNKVNVKFVFVVN